MTVSVVAMRPSKDLATFQKDPMKIGGEVKFRLSWIRPCLHLLAAMNAISIIPIALARYADVAGLDIALNIAT